MPTSPTSMLSEPKGAERIPLGTLAYFRSRLKQRMYSLVIREFKRRGLSQADLGRRLDKEPAQLSRLLSGPGNLTLDTISDLLFSISGAELSPAVDYPLAKQRANDSDYRKAALPPPASRPVKVAAAEAAAIRAQRAATEPNTLFRPNVGSHGADLPQPKLQQRLTSLPLKEALRADQPWGNPAQKFQGSLAEAV